MSNIKFKKLIREKSAYIPIIISLGLLVMMLCFAVFSSGAYHDKDEGTGAHIFK